jgi:hypothetical protein
MILVVLRDMLYMIKNKKENIADTRVYIDQSSRSDPIVYIYPPISRDMG